MNAYRVLVTGSRDWPSADAIWSALKQVCDEHGAGNVVIVHGAARGADAMAARYAEMWGIRTEVHPADWKGGYGRAAGFRRNAEMVKLGADVCLAFIRNDSRGATHCADLAEQAGIKVRRFTT